MYESPINLIEKQVAFDIEKTIEGEVWKVTKEIGVDVNKEELIKALRYDRDQYERGYYDGLNVHKWIPVSERLPEIGQRVLVSFTIEDEKKVDITYFDKHGFLRGIMDAWMPLPYPYKAESECKE